MTIGDINSQARGTGARYNAGKPPLHLIPLWIIAEADDRLAESSEARLFDSWKENARFALFALSRFQLREPPLLLEDEKSALFNGKSTLRLTG